MAQMTFFDDDRPSQATRLGPRLRALAAQGVYFGTSSWKYEGWMGSIYSPDRYSSRGKFSRRKFEAECLAEYAEVFPVVCGDFSFYQFPTQDYWKQLFAETPDSLRFALKVPEEITVANWPSHARYGSRAGRANASFLDHRLFDREFAGPIEPYRDRVAGLIFEFGTIPKATFDAAEFIRRLENVPRPTSRYLPSIRSRSATPNTSAPHTLTPSRPETLRMSSTRGRGCRNSALKSRFRGS